MPRTALAMVSLGLALASGLAAAETPQPPRTYPGARNVPAKDPAPVPQLPAPRGTNIVVNGGYETNGGVGTKVFANWTVVNQAGGFGDWLVQTGTASPLNAFPVDPPPEGTFAAMTDTNGAGSHILHQVLAVPAAGVILTCRVFVSNQAGAYFHPNTLDYTVVPNQHVRIDIMDPAAPIDDVGAGVLQNVFITNPGAPPLINYMAVTASLAPYAGTNVRLRIAEVDNQFFLNLGVDDCSTADVPVELMGFTIE